MSQLIYIRHQERRLNKVLIHPYHQISTLEELNPKFANVVFFSKLDAKAGYWSIKLDAESQMLTRIQMPFSQYCFQRLPFGLSMSLEKCEGARGIAGNFVVYGATEFENDCRLKQLDDAK